MVYMVSETWGIWNIKCISLRAYTPAVIGWVVFDSQEQNE